MKRLILLVLGFVSASVILSGCVHKITGTKYPLDVEITKENNKKISSRRLINNLAECAQADKVDPFRSISCLGRHGEDWAEAMKAKELKIISYSESKINKGKTQKFMLVFKYKNKTTFLGFPKGFVINFYRPAKEKPLVHTFSRHKNKKSPPLLFCYKLSDKISQFKVIEPTSLTIKKSGKISWSYNKKNDVSYKSYMCFKTQEKLERFLSSFISTFGDLDLQKLEFEDSPIK